jgi:hypothetical protein
MENIIIYKNRPVRVMSLEKVVSDYLYKKIKFINEKKELLKCVQELRKKT